jgi:hypothetical protein
MFGLNLMCYLKRFASIIPFSILCNIGIKPDMTFSAFFCSVLNKGGTLISRLSDGILHVVIGGTQYACYNSDLIR